jgi:hypothetical protein
VARQLISITRFPKSIPGIWDVQDPGLRYAQKWGSRSRHEKPEEMGIGALVAPVAAT